MIPVMPTQDKEFAAGAQKRSDTARQSSNRHSRDAARMRKSATDAADRLHTAQKRQRKRERDKKQRKR
jgi:hypothetical protein